MKTKWRLFFGLLIVVILIYFFKDVDFRAVWGLFKATDKTYFLLAFLTYGLSFLVFDFRSSFFIREIAPVGYWFNLKTSMAGFFVSNITPGPQTGGDPVRAYFIGKKYKKSKSKLLGVILADKSVHMVTNMLFIIASLIFILDKIPTGPQLRVVFQTALFVALLIVFSIFYVSFRKSEFNIESVMARFRWIFPRHQHKKGKQGELEKILVKHFGHFSSTFRRVVKDKKLLTIGVCFSLVYWMLIFLSAYTVFVSLGVDITLLSVVVALSLSNLIGTLSPSPGGIGLVEGVMVLVYSLLGMSLTIAFAVSLLSRIVFYFYSILVGSISLVHLEHTVK